MAIRVVVAGDRDWNHLPSVRACLQALHDLHRIELVVEGGQRGADFCAHVAATSLGFPVKTENAEWKKFGRRAGPMRNEKMLVTYHPHVVLAFHRDIESSRGTKDLLRQSMMMPWPITRILVDRYPSC